MEIHCPSCKKVNVDAATCTRCGCELQALQAIAQAAGYDITLGKNALLAGDFQDALEHAGRSWHLKHSPEAAKLAFLANVCATNYHEALLWYHRATAGCSSGLQP